MAETEAIAMDDRALFEGAIGDEPAVAEESPPRDELGRFAPKAEEVPAEAPKVEAKPETVAPPVEATEQPKDDAATVPSWRLREVREAREAAERKAEEATRERFALQTQLQQMQAELQKLQAPKSEPADFFADPDQALQQRLTPFEQRFAKLEQDVRLSSSRAAAIAVHGAPIVAEMEKSIEEAMQKNHPDINGLAAQMRTSSDPVGVAMNWYKRNKLWDVTGGDPDAYKSKVLDEALKNPEYLQKALEAARAQAGAAPGSRPNIQLPPSLSRAPGSAPSAAVDESDMSDRSLFKQAVRR